MAVTAALLLTAACTPDSELPTHDLFVKYCADCHGEDGRGDERYAEEEDVEVDLLASRRVRSGDRVFVHRRIAEGYGPMPAFEEKLSPEDLARLVDFVLELGGDDGSAEDERGVPEAAAPR